MAEGSKSTIVRAFDSAAIAEAAALIAGGQPVAVPTETVYGLAADARSADGVARIYAAKGRPDFNPLIVHVPNLAAAETLGQFGAAERALATRFWPGPLTLVVPRVAGCPVASIATAGLDTIALRVPGHRAMQALLAGTGAPLAAPSANASGRVSPTRADHVLASLDGRIALVIDDGPTRAGVESTIARVQDGAIEVLRPGPVTAAMLAMASGLPVIERKGSDIVAPGMLASHYAPGKPVRLGAVEFADDEFGIGFGGLAGDYDLSAAGDLTEAAARLFDALHAGAASAKPNIAVAAIPVEGLGAAINDRLARAAV
ncbi:L-threonylcarbamoyladenylate synthase [Sphingopyxis alaskensis]|jgi:L-threonylcarbamoyladenylate synthase|uniref:Threonylcarbamoyl-AMP synthase n=1 Tax=Sphingopyxis alaskensis (strain DSM 13593 / LMG 18877 / RB2256) TaxID=317655 RepID=Q1GS90_SPHAL|nr:L-threonylcarbamoyladenylate synthase [Sphingopyxis alaskensis]ABF53482.1 translation factor SUA5 [Sphingopyxis alaskensis RB2256]MCM3421324.1 L-threonylcarbamoyladenylate synthase [Sphingopyxis alaskensis]